jgi:micrococcal nuclease
MYKYKVKSIDKVVDGDTIKATIDLGFKVYKSITIRFLGIDAPETRTKDLGEKVKGLEAKEYLTVIFDTITKEDELVLESEKLDGFGRSLGTLYYNDVNINELLVKEGKAVPYKK